MLRPLIVLSAFLAVVFAQGTVAFAQDKDALTESIRARATKVRALVANGVAKEVPDTGLLQPFGSPDPTQSRTLADENKDRLAVFNLVAKESGLRPEEVAKMFGDRKARSAPPGPPVLAGVGPCNLVPAKAPDVQRLLVFLQQGINFASNKKYDVALKEFQSALMIDPNFLSLHMNVSSSQMGLGKYDEAVAEANEELKLVACLEPLTDAQLASFSYFMEVKDKTGATRGKEQALALRDRLPKAKAYTYYNLACALSRQKNGDAALDAVQKAIAAGYDDKKALQTDPDLATVRQNPQFNTVIAGIGKTKSSP